MKPILKGKAYTHELDGWKVSWESDGKYRHWCRQDYPNNNGLVLVIMLNPGSLSGDGRNIRRDTTLRILRGVFKGTNLNPFIINLFDYATASPSELFSNWSKRDNKLKIYDHLNDIKFKGLLYAYGNYENQKDVGEEIKNRIKIIKSRFSDIPLIECLTSKSGTPMHPIAWQCQGKKEAIRKRIKKLNRT